MGQARLKTKDLVKQIQQLEQANQQLHGMLMKAIATHGAYLGAVGDFTDEFRQAMSAKLPAQASGYAEIFDAAKAAAEALVEERVRPFPASEPAEALLVSLK